MACTTCSNTPCTCQTSTTTKCDLYVPGMRNVWVERGDSPNDVTAPGVCMLDTMTDAQIIDVLQHDEQARADLTTITTDTHLLELARTVARLPVVETMDAEQAEVNQPNNPGSIPFYAIFRGQPPFAQ